MVRELLERDDIRAFCRRFSDLNGRDPDRLPAILKEACLYAGEHLYPDEYFPPHYFVPHSLMGLIAAWEARRYLDDSDWWRPLLQGLWHMAGELRSYSVFDRPSSVPDATGTMTADPAELARAASDGQLDTFFPLLSACLERPALRKPAASILLSAALRDFTNIGHKFIYALKTAQLSRTMAWHDPVLFYPASHFLFGAPADRHVFDAAAGRAGPSGPAAPVLSARHVRPEYGEVLRLRDAVIQGDADVSELLLAMLARGCSVRGVMDALLLVASHVVHYTPERESKVWWVYPVHGFNFTASVACGLSLLPPGDVLPAVLTMGLYLREMVRATGSVGVDGSLESVSGPPPGPPVMRDIVASVRQGRPLTDRDAERLLLLAARKEGFLFSHTIKYVTFLLGALRATPGRWAADHLAAFAGFFAATPGDDRVMAVAEELLRSPI